MKRCFFAMIAVLTTAASAMAAPVELKVKLPEAGTKHMVMKTTSKGTTSSDLLPAPQQHEMTMTWDSDIKFSKPDASGSTAEVTYGRIRMDMKAANQSFSYDSDKKDDSNNPLAGPLSNLVGLSFKLHLTPDGKVDKVDGVEEAVNKLQAAGGGGLGAQVVKQVLNAKQLKETFSSSFTQGLPEKPVNVGDTWKSEQSQDMGGITFKMNTDSKLKSVESEGSHRIATIDFTGTGKIDGNNLPGGASIKVDDMKLEGTKTFDIEQGWFTGTSTTQTMKGANTVALPGGKTMKITTDNQSKIDMRITDAN